MLWHDSEAKGINGSAFPDKGNHYGVISVVLRCWCTSLSPKNPPWDDNAPNNRVTRNALDMRIDESGKRTISKSRSLQTQGSSSATLPSLSFLVFSSGNAYGILKQKLFRATSPVCLFELKPHFQISPPMAKTRNPREVIKESCTKQDQVPQKSEKPPSWAAVRSLLTCKHLQTQPQQQKQEEGQQQKQRREQTVEGSGKKCKKMKCSGSLCSNTRVMHRPEMSSLKTTRKGLRWLHPTMTVPADP
ncbi:hypothetical protein CK203_071794 [Vitis vinifera]|uniref:Uncharacterized protein n=1 Tax=Vitis vinifera TaxID=29760 RepID=A0A438C318_VITVI|nr:hypothetical protein CK203_071794 [Vitis vinifera]